MYRAAGCAAGQLCGCAGRGLAVPVWVRVRVAGGGCGRGRPPVARPPATQAEAAQPATDRQQSLPVIYSLPSQST